LKPNVAINDDDDVDDVDDVDVDGDVTVVALVVYNIFNNTITIVINKYDAILTIIT
jgi:hypothetical protein